MGHTARWNDSDKILQRNCLLTVSKLPSAPSGHTEPAESAGVLCSVLCSVLRPAPPTIHVSCTHASGPRVADSDLSFLDVVHRPSFVVGVFKFSLFLRHVVSPSLSSAPSLLAGGLRGVSCSEALTPKPPRSPSHTFFAGLRCVPPPVKLTSVPGLVRQEYLGNCNFHFQVSMPVGTSTLKPLSALPSAQAWPSEPAGVVQCIHLTAQAGLNHPARSYGVLPFSARTGFMRVAVTSFTQSRLPFMPVGMVFPLLPVSPDLQGRQFQLSRTLGTNKKTRTR